MAIILDDLALSKYWSNICHATRRIKTPLTGMGGSFVLRIKAGAHFRSVQIKKRGQILEIGNSTFQELVKGGTLRKSNQCIQLFTLSGRAVPQAASDLYLSLSRGTSIAKKIFNQNLGGRRAY